MLAAGDVDAALIHQAPDCFTAGMAQVKRMFPDYKAGGNRLLPGDGDPSDHALCCPAKRHLPQNPWALRSIYEALKKPGSRQ